MQQFFSLLSWRLFTSQHVSGVSRPSSGAQWLQWQPLVLPSYRGDSCVVFVVGPTGRPARPRTQHDCHHDTKVKPDAATAVIDFLMMGRKTPQTYWSVNKIQDNKLENCCILLVIYLNCTMMHGLTNLKEVFSFVGFSATRINERILIFTHNYVRECGIPQVRLEQKGTEWNIYNLFLGIEAKSPTA